MGAGEIQKELVFAEEEYRSRVKTVQKQLEEKGVDAFLVFQIHNMHYLTGYTTVGLLNYQFALVPREGEPTIFLRLLEGDLARLFSPFSDIEVWEDTDDPVEVTRLLLEKKGLASAHLGYEGRCMSFPPQVLERLRGALPNVKWSDMAGIVEQSRMIKLPAEIECMRQAARATAAGMKAAVEEARIGVTENDIAAAASDAIIRAGSESLTMSPIVTSGPRSAVAHTTFKRRPLENGDTVLLEWSGVYNQYSGPMMRSVVIGKPPKRLKEMWAVLVEALEAAIAAIRPGITSGEVDAASTSIIEKAGLYQYYRKRLGYSVGIAFPPDWGEGHIIDLKRNDPRKLAAGMTFHMPPALRVDGIWGFGLSETVAVTETGCEVLTNFPRELPIC